MQGTVATGGKGVGFARRARSLGRIAFGTPRLRKALISDQQAEFETLGAFYLGRVRDASSGQPTDDLLLSDSRDQTTLGIIIGMTGSGKTGLALGIIEKAAMDQIPVIAIDPKGDLANLLLTLPDLDPSDFRPWVNEEAARQKGQDPDTFSAAEAELWKTGLARWGQDGERIRRPDPRRRHPRRP